MSHNIQFAKLRSTLFLLLLLSYQSTPLIAQNADTESQDPYILWLYGVSEGRRAYETALLNEILAITEVDFGKRELIVSTMPMSPKRGWLKLKTGNGIDIITSPDSFEGDHSDAGLRVNQGILKNLLGYRRLVIRSTERKLFNELNSAEAFKSLRVGQGVSWQDSLFFKHVGINYVEAEYFGNLFLMLARKRFDYISLGAVEIEETFASNTSEEIESEIEILEDVLIFYPLPLYFIVSKFRPELSQRIETGLERMIKNGSFDRMFKQHHQKEIALLSKPGSRVFALEDPVTKKFIEPELLDSPKIIRLKSEAGTPTETQSLTR